MRDLWSRIEENSQAIAVSRELIRPDERFALTEDQNSAVARITQGLEAGEFEFLLKAPTGSGKTEVMLRVAVREALRTGGYVCLVAPTRDLVRQDCTYFRDRLAGTGFEVGELHAGVGRREREATFAGIASGALRFLVGSALLIASDEGWDILDRSALLIVDDVNAFDEREHLRLLEALDCPMLFASATPGEMRSFLERVGAFESLVEMRAMPFDVQPTKVQKAEGVWGEPAEEQLIRADALIRWHLEKKSRIFVIGRTRGDVPKLAARLESTYGLPVQQLRGDMVDTQEQRRRYRRRGMHVHGTSTRIANMTAFLSAAPSILAATNLVGSGLDIPAADLIVITDADAFGEAETEQLIGRVGRRRHPSDALLITNTTFERNPSKSAASFVRARTFMPRGARPGAFRFRR